MPTLYMNRTPGTDLFPALGHLIEGRVYDNVTKEDADALVKAGIAAEFDDENEDHAASVETHKKQDAKKTPVKGAAAKAATKAVDYDALDVPQLHAEATKRNIEGRSELKTKADLVKALEKDDKAKGK